MVLMNDILVEIPEEMQEEEAAQYVKEEMELWKAKKKTLGRVMLTLENDEVIIQSFEKSPINRVRRITGYLSNMKNFNDAKRAELADRIVHI